MYRIYCVVVNLYNPFLSNELEIDENEKHLACAYTMCIDAYISHISFLYLYIMPIFHAHNLGVSLLQVKGSKVHTKS